MRRSETRAGGSRRKDARAMRSVVPIEWLTVPWTWSNTHGSYQGVSLAPLRKASAREHVSPSEFCPGLIRACNSALGRPSLACGVSARTAGDGVDRSTLVAGSGYPSAAGAELELHGVMIGKSDPIPQRVPISRFARGGQHPANARTADRRSCSILHKALHGSTGRSDTLHQ